MILFNAHHESISFTTPGPEWGKVWSLVLDTAGEGFVKDEKNHKTGEKIPVEARSLVLLMRKE
jgi:glycogen operon protein